MFHFEMEHPVRWVDLDIQGVVNNAVYLSMMEHARWEYFGAVHQLGTPVVPFTLAGVKVDFVSPGSIGPVQIRARTARLGNTSLDMIYEIVDQGTLLVKAEATLVWMQNGKPITIPETVRQAIATFEQIDPGPTPKGFA